MGVSRSAGGVHVAASIHRREGAAGHGRVQQAAGAAGGRPGEGGSGKERGDALHHTCSPLSYLHLKKPCEKKHTLYCRPMWVWVTVSLLSTALVCSVYRSHTPQPWCVEP